MSITNLGVNLLATLTLFNWKSIALISCPDCGDKAEPGTSMESFLTDHKVNKIFLNKLIFEELKKLIFW